MNWWRTDPNYAAPAIAHSEVAALSAKLDALASKLDRIEQKQVKRTPTAEK